VSVEPEKVSADMARLLGAKGIALAARKHEESLYLFAVRMEPAPAKGAFHVPGMAGEAIVRVLGENRTLRARDGRFEDAFEPHAVHLYRVEPPKP
jgi:hypothetical protein